MLLHGEKRLSVKLQKQKPNCFVSGGSQWASLLWREAAGLPVPPSHMISFPLPVPSAQLLYWQNNQYREAGKQRGWVRALSICQDSDCTPAEWRLTWTLWKWLVSRKVTKTFTVRKDPGRLCVWDSSIPSPQFYCELPSALPIGCFQSGWRPSAGHHSGAAVLRYTLLPSNVPTCNTGTGHLSIHLSIG